MSTLEDYMQGWPPELQTMVSSIVAAGPTVDAVDAQESVLDKDLTAPPGSPAIGARYIVAAVATGLWTGYEKSIAEYSGAGWVFTTPNDGMMVWVEDEDLPYSYRTTTWGVSEPSLNEKAALAGTSGTPSVTNKFVTDAELARPSHPELDMLDVTGGAAVVAAGGDIVLAGRDLLQSQTFDTLQLIEGSADLTIDVLKPGVSGITVEITAGVGALSVAFTAGTGVLVIDLAAGGSSDDLVATAINANAAATDGYVRATSAAGGNFTLAAGPTDMAGGAGTYANNKVMVGGLEALPANETGTTAVAKWSDTGITCTTQAVGSATDVVSIAAESAGKWTQQLAAILT